MALRISVASSPFYYGKVYTKLPDGSTPDPTADAVSWAILPEGEEPDNSTSWTAGSWFPSNPGDTVFYPRIQLNTGGGITLAVGFWHAYVKIVDSPETVVLDANGAIEIY